MEYDDMWKITRQEMRIIESNGITKNRVGKEMSNDVEHQVSYVV